MGWSSGTRLFDALIETMMANVPEDDVREQIYKDMLEAFTDNDWDCTEESLGADHVYDQVHRDTYGDSEGYDEEE